MNEMLKTMPQTGTVQWIGLRPGRREAVNVVEETQIDLTGLKGDHFEGPQDAPRTVTLVQSEHLDAVASIMGIDEVDPALIRRNIVVSGINLTALKGVDFRIGEVVLRGTDRCPPCSRMEENLGPGGYNAMRGHGGITASVVQPGMVRKGDRVSLA